MFHFLFLILFSNKLPGEREEKRNIKNAQAYF
jgi:hypothetical protein